MTNIYIKALLFSMEKHRHQTRDTTGDPYVIHPIRVAETLRELGFERYDGVVIAALLHDTIEDCGVNYGTIRSEFGEVVGDIVVGVTDDNRLARKERKADMLKRMRTARWEVQLLKMVDRYDNITDKAPWMMEKDRYLRYLDETDALLEIFRRVARGITDDDKSPHNAYLTMWKNLSIEAGRQRGGVW